MSDLWDIDDSIGIIKTITLFNCNSISSNNSDDIIKGNNKCIIFQDINKIIVTSYVGPWIET